MDAPVWEVTVWEVTVWEVTVFTKNRERLLEGDIAGGFLRAIRLDPAVKRLLSTERFSVAGTLIEAWASRKSFRPNGHGEPQRLGRRHRDHARHRHRPARGGGVADGRGGRQDAAVTLGPTEGLDVAGHVASRGR